MNRNRRYSIDLFTEICNLCLAGTYTYKKWAELSSGFVSENRKCSPGVRRGQEVVHVKIFDGTENKLSIF